MSTQIAIFTREFLHDPGRCPPDRDWDYDLPVKPPQTRIQYKFDFQYNKTVHHRKTPVPTASLPIKRRRDQTPKGANLCDYCSAKCCHYFALPIDEPVCRKDYDFMRWYLLHDRASIFVDNDVWYLLVHTTCKHLQDDHRCGIYETRPQICREYTTDECEFEDDWCYEQYFETPEQVDQYADAMFGPQYSSPGINDRDSLRSRKPTSLPMLR